MPEPIINSGHTKSVSHLQAEATARERLTIVRGVMAICVILTAGGVYISVQDSTKAKDTWVIIGPIISGLASGLIGASLAKKGK